MNTEIKILIVEDEKIISLDLERKLKESGFVIAGTALNGETAIEMAREIHPDLILMDIGLPGTIDGIDAAESIRKILNVPIIFLTSYSNDKTIHRAIETNPYGYIIKPVNKERLIVIIRLAYKKFQNDRELLESKKRYQSLTENLPLMMCSIDPETSAIKLINKNFCDFLGIDQTNFEDIDFFDTISKKDIKNIKSTFSLLSPENPSHQHEQFFNISSKKTWYRCTCNSLYDNYGKLFEYQFFQEDITESRMREIKIRETNEQLRIRLKKLYCSYEITSMTENPPDSITDVLKEIVHIIHGIFDFSLGTCVQITYKEQVFQSGYYSSSASAITKPIKINNNSLGSISLFFEDVYHKKIHNQNFEEYIVFFNFLARRTGDIIKNIESQQELKKLEREIISISEWERDNIGRELHDSLGQLLTGISFLLKTVSRKVASSGINEIPEIREIKELVKESVAKCRQLSRGLSALSIENKGLHLVLDQYSTDIMSLYNISCNLFIDENIEIQDNFIVTQLFRIAQETVNNTIKHSNADIITFELKKNSSDIIFSISDNGKIIMDNSTNQGLGMSIMRYRARLIQGTFSSENTKNGFRITVRFPHTKE